MIVTDARFQGTAAGGALLNRSAPSWGSSPAPSGCAVPIDVARDVADQLATTGQAAHGGARRHRRRTRSTGPGGGVRHPVVWQPGSPADELARPATPTTRDLAVGDVEVGSVGDLVAALRRLQARRPRRPHGGASRQADLPVPVVLGRSDATPSTGPTCLVA